MDGMMSSKKGKGNGLIMKTWERCKSIGRGSQSQYNFYSNSKIMRTMRSKSWTGRNRNKSTSDVAPEGCFSVYVGAQMQRFVIKTEYANHPLFKMLLEEAESEYGYNSQGPLALPCDVDIFYKVLMEMDSQQTPQGCVSCVGVKSSSPSRSPSHLSNASHQPLLIHP